MGSEAILRETLVLHFDSVIDRIQFSSDPKEREHIYLGQALYGDGPVLLSRKLYGYHGIVRGGPGRGKTAFLERLVTQLIAGESSERAAWLESGGLEHEPTSLVILDLKGEMALFNTARLEAERAGIPFRYFTFHPGQSSHVFNFFAQSHLEELSKGHISQELLQALGAEYGQAYGASFFSSINEVVLLNTLRKAHGIDSFRKLHRFLSDSNFYAHIPGAIAKDLQDARHLTSLANRLSHVHALNITEESVADRPGVWENRIDMPSLMRSRQVVYLYLSSLQAETETATVARLAIFALITAAARRGPEDTHRVAVIADEFQTMATRNIARVLEHARSMRVPFVLAHQFREQLSDGTGADLALTVDHCTAWSLDFEATTPEDIDRIEKLSLHGAYARPGWTRSPDDVSDFGRDGVLGLATAARREAMETINVVELELPIYDHNTILELSADPSIAWFFAKLRDGYTQYVGVTPLVWEFHVSADEHAEIAREPWPAPSEETIVIDKDPFRDERPVATGAQQSVRPHAVPLKSSEPQAGTENGGTVQGGTGQSCTGRSGEGLKDRMKRLLGGNGGSGNGAGGNGSGKSGGPTNNPSPPPNADRP